MAETVFAPLILPLQINCIVVAFLILVAAVIFERQTKRYVLSVTKRFALSVAMAFITGFVMFIPCLFAVGYFVDAVRYGQFEYAKATQITDRYVEIPQSATNITLHKYASGHEVRFHIAEDALQAWMRAVEKKRKYAENFTPFRIDKSALSGLMEQHYWERRFFDRHGWAMPNDVVCYKGWRSGRGAGFDVWYSAESQTAFINAGYW